MYKILTIHIDENDAVEIHREDGSVQITSTGSTEDAVDIFIHPVHFAALRKAMSDADARSYQEPDPDGGGIGRYLSEGGSGNS